MKDALGHGSNSKGGAYPAAHQDGVNALPRCGDPVTNLEGVAREREPTPYNAPRFSDSEVAAYSQAYGTTAATNAIEGVK